MSQNPAPGRVRLPAGVAVLGLVAAVFAAALGLFLSPVANAAAPGTGHGKVGTTQGWYDGRTVTLQYEKDYYCDKTVTSGATSGCELGADAKVPPRGGPIPELYVAVPLFTPAAGVDLHLQCPVAGSCIDHPSTIDLSRIFGAGTQNALLPAHSHVIDEVQGGWWDVTVVGIKTQAAWDALTAGKSLDALQSLQASGAATGDIPTNLDLFFNVKP
jgi:hypothetical protein